MDFSGGAPAAGDSSPRWAGALPEKSRVDPLGFPGGRPSAWRFGLVGLGS